MGKPTDPPSSIRGELSLGVSWQSLSPDVLCILQNRSSRWFSNKAPRLFDWLSAGIRGEVTRRLGNEVEMLVPAEPEMISLRVVEWGTADVWEAITYLNCAALAVRDTEAGAFIDQLLTTFIAMGWSKAEQEVRRVRSKA